MRQIALTRQELHQKVWSSPMRQVAAELGISDVGLSKACKRHKIPIPPQGYWLRKESRRRIAPLPAVQEEDDLVVLNPGDDGLRRLKATVQPLVVDPITIPDSGITHKLVLMTQRAALPLKPFNGRVTFKSKDHLDVRVSPENLDRALLIADALINAAEKAGAKWTVQDGKTSLSFNNQGVAVYFIERLKKQQSVQAPTKRSDRRWGEPNWEALLPSTEFVATGQLEFRIDSYDLPQIQKTWGGAKAPLETQLAQIVTSLPLIAAGLKAHREAVAARNAELERRAQLRIQSARKFEIRRILAARLVEASEQWRQASLIRQYCAAIRDKLQADSASPQDISRLQDWLAWAEGEADRIDPITQGIASVTHDEVSLPADFDSKVRNRWW